MSLLLRNRREAGGITSILHAVNGQNGITAVTTTDSSGSSTAQTRHDEAGNLIFDGEYFYQYDAWNRLVQVNRATLDAQDQIVIGALLKHHTYDGLGRLIRTQSPFPDPDPPRPGTSAPSGSSTTGCGGSRRFRSRR